MKILFVCLGNICRSPMAQGIFENLISKSNQAKNFVTEVDSAGTANYHIGKLPDTRMRKTAIEHGFNIDHLRGRQVAIEDFKKFDAIFAMDSRNYKNLLDICPEEYKSKVSLFLANSQQTNIVDVPDPFHGEENDFQNVLSLIKNRNIEILNEIVN